MWNGLCAHRCSIHINYSLVPISSTIVERIIWSICVMEHKITASWSYSLKYVSENLFLVHILVCNHHNGSYEIFSWYTNQNNGSYNVMWNFTKQTFA